MSAAAVPTASAAKRRATNGVKTFPSPIDLISSDDPTQWTKMVDLSSQLPEEAKAFNAANPSTAIQLLGKCEFMNPGMSHKDRIAKVMLQCAEARGDLRGQGGEKKVILAASSGNTGCSLALVGTIMGYEVVIITNAKCSVEKQTHIRANGATLWLAESLPERFPAELGSEKDYMKQEDLLVAAFPEKYYSVNQYNNPDNMAAHHDSTGPEIWAQTGGAVTHFCMSGRTGGTVQGVGKFLKSQRPDVRIVLADPEKSRLAGMVRKRDDDAAGTSALAAVDAQIAKEGKGVAVEGAGKDSLTDIMKLEATTLKYVDVAIPVNDFDAFDQCRATATSGLLVGGSSGVNLCAARRVAAQCAAEPPREGGVTIVTLLCDHGIKYLSKFFNDDWMTKNDTRGTN